MFTKDSILHSQKCMYTLIRLEIRLTVQSVYDGIINVSAQESLLNRHQCVTRRIFKSKAQLCVLSTRPLCSTLFVPLCTWQFKVYAMALTVICHTVPLSTVFHLTTLPQCSSAFWILWPTVFCLHFLNVHLCSVSVATMFFNILPTTCSTVLFQHFHNVPLCSIMFDTVCSAGSMLC